MARFIYNFAYLINIIIVNNNNGNGSSNSSISRSIVNSMIITAIKSVYNSIKYSLFLVHI